MKLFGECSGSPRAKEEARSDDDAVYGFDWDLGVGWKAIAGRRVAEKDHAAKSVIRRFVGALKAVVRESWYGSALTAHR